MKISGHFNLDTTKYYFLVPIYQDVTGLCISDSIDLYVKKQSTAAQSPAVLEHAAVNSVAREAAWIREFLAGQAVGPLDVSIAVKIDNAPRGCGPG